MATSKMVMTADYAPWWIDGTLSHRLPEINMSPNPGGSES